MMMMQVANQANCAQLRQVALSLLPNECASLGNRVLDVRSLDLKKFLSWDPTRLQDYLIIACLDLWSLSYFSTSSPPLSLDSAFPHGPSPAPLELMPELMPPFTLLSERWSKASCRYERSRLVQIAGAYCYSNSTVSTDVSFPVFAKQALSFLQAECEGAIAHSWSTDHLSVHMEKLSKSCSSFFGYDSRSYSIAEDMELDCALLSLLSNRELKTNTSLSLLQCFVFMLWQDDIGIHQLQQVLGCFERRDLDKNQRRRLARLASYMMKTRTLKMHYRLLIDKLSALCYDPIAAENSASTGRSRHGSELSPMSWTDEGDEIATQVFRLVSEVDDALCFWIHCYWAGKDATLAIPESLPSLLSLDLLGLAGVATPSLVSLSEADAESLLEVVPLKAAIMPTIENAIEKLRQGKPVDNAELQGHLVDALTRLLSDPELVQLDDEAERALFIESWLEEYLSEALLVCRQLATQPREFESGFVLAGVEKIRLWATCVDLSLHAVISDTHLQLLERIRTQFIAAGLGLEPKDGFVRLYHRSTINRTHQFMNCGLAHELLTQRGDFNSTSTPGFYLFESCEDALWHRVSRVASTPDMSAILVFDVPTSVLEAWSHAFPTSPEEWQDWVFACRNHLRFNRKVNFTPWANRAPRSSDRSTVQDYLESVTKDLRRHYFIAGPMARSEKLDVSRMAMWLDDGTPDRNWIRSRMPEGLRQGKMQCCFLSHADLENTADALAELPAYLVATIQVEGRGRL
jgi:hypothetical protein